MEYTKEEMREKIENSITRSVLNQYWSADYGWRLGIYEGENGEMKAIVGQDCGREIAKDERPITIIEVPGYGSLDEQYFTEGWIVKKENGIYTTNDGRELTFPEVIYEVAMEGDNYDAIQEIVDRLMDDIDEYEK